ncbi:Rho termination factor N-terminal domain-containing protein [Bythopirellula goksoeyrii]|uniref:Rho termination factor-like N-terminal domain-containing protein n=1 Tax=Bythopirellula goksoeyrii TaxID=1400387 RepID=A0A5B9QIU8_9BACT|nr:Rho termination factor N-terminal domain-containing protein [Bythopirellula goksoeyrii]QEG36956.1 hypothetical protein Pr1d_42960 [Bythopirellula goksoeyrii]
MPQAWSDKDERQYEHIKKSARDRGKSEERAEEIAARTVNKTRRESGRTPNKSTQGTGNPSSPLEDRTLKELKNLASERDIEGRSKMNKSQLVKALRKQY